MVVPNGLRRSLEGASCRLEHPAPTAESRLRPLLAGQSLPLARIDVGLADPMPERLERDAEILGYPGQRVARLAGQADGLSLELR